MKTNFRIGNGVVVDPWALLAEIGRLKETNKIVSARLDAAIGRDPSNRQKMSARTKHARNAVTRITRAHHMPAVTLCQVAIHTGRTHQIRVHLSAIGHPIVGDALYGGVHRRVAGDIKAIQRLTRPFSKHKVLQDHYRQFQLQYRE